MRTHTHTHTHTHTRALTQTKAFYLEENVLFHCIVIEKKKTKTKKDRVMGTE